MQLLNFRDIFFKTLLEEQKNKTIVIFIAGKSGVGKSLLMLKFMYEFEKYASEMYGINFNFDLDKQIVYTPDQYANKIKEWINSKYFTFGIDESRFLVSSRTWQSFLNRVITEVNATIRQLKKNNAGYCGVIFLNSQDLRDVDLNLRKTIDYLILLKKPEGKSHRIFSIYSYKYNIFENKEYLVTKVIKTDSGHYSFKYVYTNMLDNKEIIEQFENKVVEAKAKILKKKFEHLMYELKKELGEVFDKSILQNDEVFEMIKNMATFGKKGVYFTKEKQQIIMKMFNLTKKEFKEEFMPTFLEELKRRNLI